MGNSNTPQVGGIAIQTQKSFYLPGETVSGFIYIQLNSQVQGNQLYLKIKGKESSYWITIIYVNNQQVRVPHYGHNPFINYKIPVYRWNTPFVPAGQYCIPFSFVLPQNIPGSVKDIWNHDGIFGKDASATIDYKLKAELHSPTGQVHIKGKTPLLVKDEYRSPVVPLSGDSNLPMKSWCCCSKGFVNMKCYFEKNAYMPGETATVICDIDNSQGRIAITNMIGRLTYSLITSNESDSKTFTKTNSELILPGVAIGETKTGANQLKFTLPIITEKNVDGEEIATTNGHFVKCVYMLQVYAPIDSCCCSCCSTEPMMEIPVNVSSQPTRFAAPIQAPAGWAPQQIPLVTVNLNPLYEYASKKVGKIKHFMPEVPTPATAGPQMAYPTGMQMGHMTQIGVPNSPPMIGGNAYAPAKI